MSTVAILGGGISGLSCAYYLKTLGGSKIKYLFLLEKSSKFGGWIQTTRFPDGAIFEHGPRTLRYGTTSGYNALALADELGLETRILPVGKNNTAAKTNYILANNNLHPIPRSMTSIFKTHSPFSEPFYKYLLNDLKTKKSTLDDESVHSFFERRMGEDVARFVFDPICRGICAGNAREISIRSLFPSVYEAETKHGSIVWGTLRSKNTYPEFNHSMLNRKATMEFWKMWTLKNGLTELVDALACSVEERNVSDLIFSAKCSGLKFGGGKATVMSDGESIEVDHVFSCLPSHELSHLLSAYPALSTTLSEIISVDVAVVYLEYENDVLTKPGFGFLSPSSEDCKVLGIVFDSCVFPELNGSNRTRITCMMGGHWFRELFGDPESVSDDTLLKIAIMEAGRQLQIMEDPVRTKIIVQKRCIPQYHIGHHLKLDRINEEIKQNNLKLSLLGASYKGAGVPDCIYNSKLEVQEYLKSL